MNMMRIFVVLGLATGVALAAGVWWGLRGPTASPTSGQAGASNATGAAAEAAIAPLRLGLVPERDLFAQRRRFRVLADHLQDVLGRPVELVTFSTYTGILAGFEHAEVDAAFLGSFITVLVHDRFGGRPLVKPVYAGEVSSYRGVVFVRADSPIQSLSDLGGEGCLAMVRATMAGHLFPLSLARDQTWLDANAEGAICWINSHDEVIAAVADRRVPAGAVKDLRLAAFERANPQVRFRRLAVSDAVPENALVVAAGLDASVVSVLRKTLLGLDATDAGRAVLDSFGTLRFVPCAIEEYQLVYDLVNLLRDRWASLGIAGPPPRSAPTPTPTPDTEPEREPEPELDPSAS